MNNNTLEEISRLINQKKIHEAQIELSKLGPEFHKNIPFNKSSKFIKVGFISSFFFEHVISKLFRNWIIKLDKNKFKTFVYHFGSRIRCEF